VWGLAACGSSGASPASGGTPADAGARDGAVVPPPSDGGDGSSDAPDDGPAGPSVLDAECPDACGGTPVASGLLDPVSLAVDDTDVYWISGGDLSVMKTATAAPGALVTLALAQSNLGPDTVAALTVDTTDVLFASTDIGGNLTLMSVPKSGSTDAAALQMARISIEPSTLDYLSIANDGQNAYVVDPGDSTLQVFPIAGGAVYSLASPSPNPAQVTAAAGSVFFSASGSWTSQAFLNDGAVLGAMPVDGGVPMPIATMQNQPGGVAVDGSTLYWTTVSGGTVMKAALPSGPAVLLAWGQADPTFIAVGGTYVYWSNPVEGTVVKTAKAGGGPAIVVGSGYSKPGPVAVDATSVYWVDEGTAFTRDGAILRAPL
jgi:hypothetical protein